MPCAASALPAASLLALLPPPRESEQGQPFANLPQAQLMNCVIAVREISAERKAQGGGGRVLRVSCCTFRDWSSLGASWHPPTEGNSAKRCRRLILNLTDVIFSLRGQESADLGSFWSPLGLSYKHGMWAGQMMNAPAGKGGTKSTTLVGLHLILSLIRLVLFISYLALCATITCAYRWSGFRLTWLNVAAS